MADDDSDYDGTDTDWIANSAKGYGIGYTREQALMAMFAHVRIDSEIEVQLIEHIGDASMGPLGVEVDHPVTEESVTVSRPQARELTNAAREAMAITADVFADNG